MGSPPREWTLVTWSWAPHQPISRDPRFVDVSLTHKHIIHNWIPCIGGYIHLPPVVLSMDDTTHWVTHFLVDSVVCFANTCPWQWLVQSMVLSTLWTTGCWVVTLRDDPSLPGLKHNAKSSARTIRPLHLVQVLTVTHNIYFRKTKYVIPPSRTFICILTIFHLGLLQFILIHIYGTTVLLVKDPFPVAT